jgi:Sec-independent protein secretion pathway component TatC
MAQRDEIVSVMSLGEHLMELRRCLIRSLAGVGLLGAAALWYGRSIVRWLCEPLFQVQHQLGLPRQTVSLTITGGFMAYLKVSLIAALAVGLPWIALQLWHFVAPALRRAERRMFLLLVPYSLGMTVISVAFVYYLFLPAALSFLLTFSTDYPPARDDGRPSSLAYVTAFFSHANAALTHSQPPPVLKPAPGEAAGPATSSQRFRVPTLDRDPQDVHDGEMWFNRSLGELRIATNGKARAVQVVGPSFMVPQIDISGYLDLAAMSLLTMAISFQLPVGIAVAAALGVVDAASLAAHRAKVVWACFLIGVFITPSQDLVSNVLFPLLLWGLFELGLLTARLVLPGRDSRLSGASGPVHLRRGCGGPGCSSRSQ